MAKAKSGANKPGGEGTQVRIDPEIARMAKVVAIEDGISVLEYISNYLRPKVVADYRRVQAEGAAKLANLEKQKKGEGDSSQ